MPAPPAAHDALALLVATAASLDLEDVEAAARLRVAAHEITAHLATIRRLPAHLVVDLDDPHVVVARTLAVASRGLARPPVETRRVTRRPTSSTAEADSLDVAVRS